MDKKPIIGICYDFDKTLSPNNMQASGYFKSIGYDDEEFWKESNSMAENNDMDQNLAYMYKMVEEAKGKLIFNEKTLREYGSKVVLYDGVEEWFERIRKYGEEKGVKIEHYIISSGLKEMIEGTKPARENAFKKIYASSFYYDKKTKVAKWPAQVVNYTNKTQFLFRIKKGVLDINNPSVNDHFKEEEIRIPFENIIYIGDSETDVPCMELVNANRGYSIGVYNPTKNDRERVYKMMEDGRIKYYAPASYIENSELDKIIKLIINKVYFESKLKDKYMKCVMEGKNK